MSQGKTWNNTQNYALVAVSLYLLLHYITNVIFFVLFYKKSVTYNTHLKYSESSNIQICSQKKMLPSGVFLARVSVEDIFP